jgi:nucleoside-diphosphate-sugar epimerase
MRIFITGISSDMGRTIAGLLIAQGHEILGLTRNPGLELEGCRLIVGDVMAPRSYGEALDHCSLIIHLAGITHADRAEKYFAVNVAGARKLLTRAERSRVKRFIYMSTRAIGPGCGAYGESKRMFEELLRASDLDSVILRVAEVYGIGKSEGINALMAKVLHGRIIPIPGKGQYEIAPVHVNDIARAIVKICGASNIREETYTLCGPKSYSIREFVAVICQIVGLVRVGILVPIFVIRLALVFKNLLNLPLKIVDDQVQRLAVKKDTDFSMAEKDFGFSPVSVEMWLQKEFKGDFGVSHGIDLKGGIRQKFPGVLLFNGPAASE